MMRGVYALVGLGVSLREMEEDYSLRDFNGVVAAINQQRSPR